MVGRETPRSICRVGIVEDQQLFRDFLENAFRFDDRFEVVVSSPVLQPMYDRLSELRVDLWWLDLGLPDGSGIDFARTVKAASATSRIIILTGQNDPAAVREALLLGVEGFFSKNEPLNVFRDAVETLHAGRNFYSPHALKTLARLDAYTENLSSITAREREVLKLTAQGFTVKEIADQLHVAESTVKTHRKALLEKCDSRNIADLTRFALKFGILGE